MSFNIVTINSVLFILALFAALVSVARLMLRPASPRSAEPEAMRYRLCLLLIFGFALIIRLWRFGAVPGGVNQDGAMAAVDGKALADYGTDRFGTRLPAHLYAWGFGQMSSLLSYLIAVFVKLGGLSVVSMRLPQLIVSMLGLVFFSLLMGELFGRRTALAAAAFAAVDPWHFTQSRWALDCNLLPHFFVAAMYLLLRALRGGRLSSDALSGAARLKSREFISLCASMLCFGLCMYCYGISLYTIPPLLFVLAAYCLIKKKLRPGDVVLSAVVYLFVSWPFLLTMAINYFKWDTVSLPFVTMQYFPASVRSGSILFFADEPLSQLARNLRSLLNVTLLQRPDLLWNEVPHFGTMYLCTMPFVVAGFFELARTKRENKFILLAMLLTGVLAGLFTNNVNINRTNLIYYGIMAFAVLGMRLAARELRHVRAASICAYTLLAVMFLACYFGSYADSIRHSFFDGFGDALLCAERSGADTLYITADTQYHGSRNVSEILTLFYDCTDAHYFQGKSTVNNGRSLPPYTARFRYLSFDPARALEAASENAACVIRAEDLSCFDAELFELIPFGDYYAAVIK